MNLSETSFVTRETARDGAFEVRIFTPAEGAAVRRPPDARHRVRDSFEALLGDGVDAVVLRLGVGPCASRFA